MRNPLFYVLERQIAHATGTSCYHFGYSSLCKEHVLKNVAEVKVHMLPPTADRLTRTLRVTPSGQLLANLGKRRKRSFRKIALYIHCANMYYVVPYVQSTFIYAKMCVAEKC